MSPPRSSVYVGTVVHKRLEPRTHAFSYRVFALCLDVDEIAELSRDLRFFSRGRFNLLSFHDADHGDRATTDIAGHIRSVLAGAGLEQFTARVELICYPRILGYVFNPLSVYFGYDREERLGAIAYEVTNTLGERRSYVIPVAAASENNGVISQQCAKELYVSPFTGPTGSYGFHILPPGQTVVIGVDFREADRPVLKTHFRGERVPLSDGSIAGMLLRHPLMTAKVTMAIHLQAARLWLKGVPVRSYHASPRYSVTTVAPPSSE
jgi:DUF1365 family protein